MKNLMQEYQFIIYLSKPFWSEKESDTLYTLIEHPLNWTLVSNLIKRHRIAPIAYYNLQKNKLSEMLPSGLFQELQEQYQNNEEKQRQYWKECSPVFQALEKANIQYCALKGVVLQEILYPPYTRDYNDMDVLIQRDDYPTVWKIFNRYGFSNNQDLNQLKNKRERLFLLLNTYEFPKFEKVTDVQNKVYIDLQHTHTLAKKMGYCVNSSDEVNAVETMMVENIPVRRQNLNHLLIHLCTHAFGDSATISELVLHKGFRLKSFGDIVGLAEKYITAYQSDDFYNTVMQTNTIKPVYFCLYYCMQLYQVSDAFIEITKRLEEALTDLSFLNQYGVENGTDGVFDWDCSPEERFFSMDSVNEVREQAKCKIEKYSDYDTRL